MQILDYVIIALAAVGLIVGVAKGFFKLLFAFAGVIVISIGTAYLFPYPQGWLSGVITDSNVCSIVAMIITFVVLAIIYGIITNLLLKLVHKVGALKTIDRILGLLLGVALVYAIFAVLIAVLTQTADTFMPWTKSWMGEQLQNSLIVNSVYKNNFFGNWLFEVIGEKLPSLLPTAA